MIKHILLIIFTIVFISAKSQNIQILDSVGNVINGQTVYMTTTVDPLDNYQVSHIYFPIKNNTSSSLDIKFKRYELITVSNTKNYWCWSFCAMPTFSGTKPFWEDNNAVSFVANEVKDDFMRAYHMPIGISGLATYRYVLYDDANPSDSAFVDIHFDMLTSAKKNINTFAKTDLNIFPNPASKKVYLNFSKSAEIEQANCVLIIRDMLGEVVKEYDLRNEFTKHEMDISEINPGIYFYTLLVNGKSILTKRLVIK